jgi:hypothetical protein
VFSQTAFSVFLGMGESNCSWNRKALLHRDTMLAAAAVYRGKGAAHCFHPCLTKEPGLFHVNSLHIANAFSFPGKVPADFSVLPLRTQFP